MPEKPTWTRLLQTAKSHLPCNKLLTLSRLSLGPSLPLPLMLNHRRLHRILPGEPLSASARLALSCFCFALTACFALHYLPLQQTRHLLYSLLLVLSRHSIRLALSPSPLSCSRLVCALFSSILNSTCFHLWQIGASLSTTPPPPLPLPVVAVSPYLPCLLPPDCIRTHLTLTQRRGLPASRLRPLTRLTQTLPLSLTTEPYSTWTHSIHLLCLGCFCCSNITLALTFDHPTRRSISLTTSRSPSYNVVLEQFSSTPSTTPYQAEFGSRKHT